MSDAVYYCPNCAAHCWFGFPHRCEECGWPDLEAARKIAAAKRMKIEAAQLRSDMNKEKRDG